MDIEKLKKMLNTCFQQGKLETALNIINKYPSLISDNDLEIINKFYDFNFYPGIEACLKHDTEIAKLSEFLESAFSSSDYTAVHILTHKGLITTATLKENHKNICMNGNIRFMKYLTEFGYDPTMVDENNQNGINYIRHFSDEKKSLITKYLLSEGCAVLTGEDGKEELSVCAMRKEWGTVDVYIKAGIDVFNERFNVSGINLVNYIKSVNPELGAQILRERMESEMKGTDENKITIKKKETF